MPSSTNPPPRAKRKARNVTPKRSARSAPISSKISGRSRFPVLSAAALFLGVCLSYLGIQLHSRYTLSWQSPLVIHLRWPIVIADRDKTEAAREAQLDQNGRPLTAYQQYACRKFGAACRIALAIQRAENPQGKCEIYHYNTDGTLDWGYFQINTVHLKRPGLNLRDLLNCRANIDFAYALYLERQGFSPWSTYKSGAYRKFLRDQ